METLEPPLNLPLDSGGVAILIKTSILEHYDIAIMSDKFEGILWVQLIQTE